MQRGRKKEEGEGNEERKKKKKNFSLEKERADIRVKSLQANSVWCFAIYLDHPIESHHQATALP